MVAPQNREENASEASLIGQAKLMGSAKIPIAPLLPNLLDVYGAPIKKKLEFKRLKEGELNYNDAVTVGRATCTIKLAGDYLTKFESVGEGVPGAPKKWISDIHQLPSEDPNFYWRIRCEAITGERMPLNDVVHQGKPSCYI